MTHPYIIAIDPGGTSGIAFQTGDGNIGTTTVSTMEELLQLMRVREYDWDYIVVENFLADNRVSKDGLHTIRLVGAVCAYGILYDTPVHVQVPQFRYSSRMEMEQLIPTLEHYPIIHERDALMHLLAFKEKTLPKLEPKWIVE